MDFVLLRKPQAIMREVSSQRLDRVSRPFGKLRNLSLAQQRLVRQRRQTSQIYTGEVQLQFLVIEPRRIKVRALTATSQSQCQFKKGGFASFSKFDKLSELRRERSVMAAIDDLFAPRGLEMYVPSLARIRQDLWERLDAETCLILEVADYLGLHPTLGLTVNDLDRLESMLPGHLWHAISEYAVSGRSRVFEHDLRSVVQRIAASSALTK
jgi:hypothetical protein